MLELEVYGRLFFVEVPEGALLPGKSRVVDKDLSYVGAMEVDSPLDPEAVSTRASPENAGIDVLCRSLRIRSLDLLRSHPICPRCRHVNVQNTCQLLAQRERTHVGN